MRIESGEWISCYSVIVNDKNYTVDNIHLYDASGIVVSTGFGWFECKGYPSRIKSIELPIDKIKLRRKPKFDGVVFVMLVKKWNGTKAELYIPCDMLGIHYVGKEYDKGVYQVYAIYEGEQEIYIRRFIENAGANLCDIEAEYEKMHESIRLYGFGCNVDDIVDTLDKMRNLAMDYKAERERLNSLTADSIEL